LTLGVVEEDGDGDGDNGARFPSKVIDEVFERFSNIFSLTHI
jgi:hypothetical protein